MEKYLGKGIAKDNSYIFLKFQCTNGVDTYKEIFYIKEEHQIHKGYGYCERTPDFEITIFGKTYCCFWRSNTTGCDNLCYEKGE